MIKYHWFVFLILISWKSVAQERSYNSYIELAQSFEASNPDSVLFYARQALKVESVNQSDAYYWMGVGHRIYFTVRDANGCTFESNEFDVVLGITNMDVLIYPNPVSDVLKIEGVAFDELSIYNLTGQELLISTSGSVPVRGLTKGTYIIRLFKDQKEIHNQKLIVN